MAEIPQTVGAPEGHEPYYLRMSRDAGFFQDLLDTADYEDLVNWEKALADFAKSETDEGGFFERRPNREGEQLVKHRRVQLQRKIYDREDHL